MFIFDYIRLFKLITDTEAQNEAAGFLIDNNKTLAVAESCTGGLLSSLMTDVSGSSSYMKPVLIMPLQQRALPGLQAVVIQNRLDWFI